MNVAQTLADRAVVLLLGVAVGACVGWSFGIDHAVPRPSAPRAVAADAAADALPAPRERPLSDVMAARQCPGTWSNVLGAVAQDRPIRVGVFGDSYGDGVFAALQQQLPRRDGFEVTKYSHLSTGFTRYRSLNLEDDAAARLGSEPLDVAVISFGANDDQPIFTTKRKYAGLMSPEWQEEIGPRVDRFVALLRAHHAIVYWVGLPPMREPAVDAGMQSVNAFYARRMAALGVPFMDSRPIVAGPDGGFSAYLPDSKTGKSVQMRLGDGIHMTFQGYVAITRTVAGRIRDYVAGVRSANAAGQARL